MFAGRVKEAAVSTMPTLHPLSALPANKVLCTFSAVQSTVSRGLSDASTLPWPGWIRNVWWGKKQTNKQKTVASWERSEWWILEGKKYKHGWINYRRVETSHRSSSSM